MDLRRLFPGPIRLAITAAWGLCCALTLLGGSATVPALVAWGGLSALFFGLLANRFYRDWAVAASLGTLAAALGCLACSEYLMGRWDNLAQTLQVVPFLSLVAVVLAGISLLAALHARRHSRSRSPW